MQSSEAPGQCLGLIFRIHVSTEFDLAISDLGRLGEEHICEGKILMFI